MIPYFKIENAAKILAEAAHPEKIILFGSYARGEAGEDSDVDFLDGAIRSAAAPPVAGAWAEFIPGLLAGCNIRIRD